MDIDIGTGHVRDAVEVLEAWNRWKAARKGGLEAQVGYRNELKQDISKHLQSEDERPWPDVIVRDIARMDEYPKLDDSLWGISPWFKVEKQGLYHRGFEVMLRLVEVELSETEAQEVKHGGEIVLIVGRIPFDSIVDVDWEGDEHYSDPHFYCRFEHKEGCYESIEVYRKAYPDIDPNYWQHLDGVRFKPIRRSRFERWRRHRKMEKARREFGSMGRDSAVLSE